MMLGSCFEVAKTGTVTGCLEVLTACLIPSMIPIGYPLYTQAGMSNISPRCKSVEAPCAFNRHLPF
jgi:hypothetical protein